MYSWSLALAGRDVTSPPGGDHRHSRRPHDLQRSAVETHVAGPGLAALRHACVEQTPPTFSPRVRHSVRGEESSHRFIPYRSVIKCRYGWLTGMHLCMQACHVPPPIRSAVRLQLSTRSRDAAAFELEMRGRRRIMTRPGNDCMDLRIASLRGDGEARRQGATSGGLKAEAGRGVKCVPSLAGIFSAREGGVEVRCC